MSEVCKQIGACIKQLRNEKSLTQAQLSELAKVSVKQISKMENGHGDVSIIAVGRVFRAFGSPARLLLYENPSPSGDPYWNDPENMISLMRGKDDIEAGRGTKISVEEIREMLENPDEPIEADKPKETTANKSGVYTYNGKILAIDI